MLSALPTFCELPDAFAPRLFRVKRADAPWEREQARRLRRAVFCAEQGVFVGDDRDAIDDHAQCLVAVTCVAGMPDQVVGTVRIHVGNGVHDAWAASLLPPADAPLWWGSRLAVHPSFRRVGALGATLVRLAVGTARAQGAARFVGLIQQQNVALFERLHWTALAPLSVHGRPHVLMHAALDSYAPCDRPDRGLAARGGSRP